MHTIHEAKNADQLQAMRYTRAKIFGAAQDRSSSGVTMPQKSALSGDPVDEALKVLTPAWPLQNTVAVNPFWNMRDQSFWSSLNKLRPCLHQQLLLSIDYFRQKYAKGEITPEALSDALEESRDLWPMLPASVPEILNSTWGETRFSHKVETVAEITPHALPLHSFVVDEIGKFAGAYFDQNQALIKFPWKHLSFWKAWLEVTQIDRSLAIAGFKSYRSQLPDLAALSPREAIGFMLKSIGISSPAGQYLYLQRAAASVIGWGSQFRYFEWQKNLGYSVSANPEPVELLAVRIAYDYLIYKQCLPQSEAAYRQWATALNSCTVQDGTDDEFFGILYTWQLALELSYQKETASSFRLAPATRDTGHDYQLIFCIDVRSEMIRRHIEAVDGRCRTRGFAGFFGAALDFKKFDERSVGHRLPVLLQPAIRIQETVSAERTKAYNSLSTTVVASYFRNLRKAPLGSFLFVELFGILSVANLLRRTVKSLTLRFGEQRLPERFRSVTGEAEKGEAIHCDKQETLGTVDKAAFAANALTHMGLRDFTAKLILIVGHGADTTNNAFGSSLDCGACGGHAGDVNARFLVTLLNDQQVRLHLRDKGFDIPDSCRFVAALHETVTDEIYLLEEGSLPADLASVYEALKLKLRQASSQCRAERQSARSHCLDKSASHRSTNWSEVRPEWGLCGNAGFIVAPRERTIGVNLSSRAFLHDYDWNTDKDFKTLELIMTAPMVVTNWINMQYFASVVAPRHYGSGNKVLHNLTNEIGVVEGNGGDLRIGLPIQSVHDGEKFVHDPLRLTVFIEAPRAEIEKIIKKHAVVADLVVNQWLHIAQIDPQSRAVHRRLRDGSYTELQL